MKKVHKMHALVSSIVNRHDQITCSGTAVWVTPLSVALAQEMKFTCLPNFIDCCCVFYREKFSWQGVHFGLYGALVLVYYNNV